MSENRQVLLESLKNTFEFFKERKTVGRMITEHVIFIPSVLLVEQEGETSDFIKATKAIKKNEGLGCPVEINEVSNPRIHGTAGIEFIFSFSEDTQFDKIISVLNAKLNK